MSTENAPAAPAGRQMEFVLQVPVQFGQELIERLTLRPRGKHLRDYTLPMRQEPGEDLPVLLFQPYALAEVGLKMAEVAGVRTVLDKMDVADVWGLAQVVFGFINGGPATGSAPSR